MANQYEKFSGRLISAIDGIINDFYRKKIANAPQSFIKEIYADIAEYCTRKGKRIRPVLLMAAYSGYKSGKKNENEMLLPAAAIEIMHSFLLIQDDIIDKALTRRGGDAMHVAAEKRYGRKKDGIGIDIASIAADVIFANALELTASADICNRARKRFLSVFAATYEKTAFGQILDILSSRPDKLNVSEDIPMQISAMKTAYYTIYYPMLMGCVLAMPENPEEKKRIEAFAIPLGLAFQIRDDILGVFGSEEETGKSTDSDIREGKLTLLVQSAFELLPPKKRREFSSRFLSAEKTEEDIRIIKAYISESGGLAAAKEKQAALLNEAKSALYNLSVSKSCKDILSCLPELIEVC